jgi:hypothetical protein
MQKVEGSSPFIRSKRACKLPGSVVLPVNGSECVARFVLGLARDDVPSRLAFVEVSYWFRCKPKARKSCKSAESLASGVEEQAAAGRSCIHRVGIAPSASAEGHMCEAPRVLERDLGRGFPPEKELRGMCAGCNVVTTADRRAWRT